MWVQEVLYGLCTVLVWIKQNSYRTDFNEVKLPEGRVEHRLYVELIMLSA